MLKKPIDKKGRFSYTYISIKSLWYSPPLTLQSKFDILAPYARPRHIVHFLYLVHNLKTTFIINPTSHTWFLYQISKLYLYTFKLLHMVSISVHISTFVDYFKISKNPMVRLSYIITKVRIPHFKISGSIPIRNLTPFSGQFGTI